MQMDSNNSISILFRTEYSKIIAVLCKTFGLSQIEIAEDIVADTFVLATETWSIKGIPKSPVGWLYTVAKNKTKDYLKRQQLFLKKIEPEITHTKEKSYEIVLDLSSQNITDSQLQMLFAICHPSLSIEAQIALSLRILCGFSVEQITSAFLANKETINKRLYRAKESLRKNKISIAFPERKHLKSRLTSVLISLYLLFNEGYYSNSKDEQLNRDFCLEALRLTLLLVNNKITHLPEVDALIALMCFHASRFDARTSNNGLLLYEEQDTSLWNNELIKKGEYYLNKSSLGEIVSKYHLEAAIAFWHTQKESEEKWENILQLYNYLLQIEYSPIIALNRTYALSKANSVEEAIKEVEKINLKNSHLFHCLLASFYIKINKEKTLSHLKKALTLAISKRDKDLIKHRISSL